MLTYRRTYIAFFLLMFLVLISDFFLDVPLLIYALITTVFIAVIVWGTSSIDSGFCMKAFCKGNPDSKTIGLTFDDGPDKNVTPRVLDILEKYNIQAAFFCIGERIAKEPDLIRRMSRDGHIIGNHSYTHHFFFDLFTKNKIAEEILSTSAIIKQITGKRIKLFRPPYGVINPPLADVLKKYDFLIMGWSLRSRDTVIKDTEILMERLSSRLQNGDIVLFHDRLEYMTDVLDRFINLAKSEGYSFERPDKLLNVNAYE